MSSNPIGTKRSSLQRHSQRSLRRKIIEQANEGLKMNQNQLVGNKRIIWKINVWISQLYFYFLEYNPQLGDVTRATRVAYVKFMKKKLEADETKDSTTTATTKDEKSTTRSTVKKAEVYYLLRNISSFRFLKH